MEQDAAAIRIDLRKCPLADGRGKTVILWTGEPLVFLKREDNKP